MKTIKTRFIKDFGEELAGKVEECAVGHSNEVNSRNKGEDPFKWALLICIGYECLSKTNYREYHHIPLKPSWKVIKSWIKKYGELGTHTGDLDYLALFGGAYNEFVKKEKKECK